MTDNSTDEPFVLAVETVDIGWSLHDNPAVTIKYRPRQYDCKVEKGRLTEIATLITVKSASGTTFKITRKQGGKYEAVSWFTWVRKRNQNQGFEWYEPSFSNEDFYIGENTTLTYNPRTKGFKVNNGRILKTTITVQLPSGQIRTITRNSSGEYVNHAQTSSYHRGYPR